MSRSRVCITKIGGSLLSSVDLPRRLREWLRDEMAEHSETHFVIIAGGGNLVEAVREIDRDSAIEVVAAHWICVDLMDVNCRLLSAMLPEIAVVDRFEQLKTCIEHPGATIFCPGHFLRQIEPTCSGTKLTADWSVTSDSISARLAVVCEAADLVLLKSIAPPLAQSGAIEEWSSNLGALGYVDSFLPKLAAALTNLRFAVLPECKSSSGEDANH
jgi:5-(aminomethyl)-3-furanmethanol phosphate kinase